MWFRDKIFKWLPNDEDDEGQDGESIVSQDLIDWEGQHSNLMVQEGIEHDGKLNASYRRSSHKRGGSAQFIADTAINEETKHQK